MAWVDIANFLGANNLAHGRGTAAAASGEVVPARPTRRSVTVRNIHATESCYLGAGTVATDAGFLLKAQESISIDTIVAINGIRAGSVDVPVAYLETFD
jgi:hypothetical protein